SHPVGTRRESPFVSHRWPPRISCTAALSATRRRYGQESPLSHHRRQVRALWDNSQPPPRRNSLHSRKKQTRADEGPAGGIRRCHQLRRSWHSCQRRTRRADFTYSLCWLVCRIAAQRSFSYSAESARQYHRNAATRTTPPRTTVAEFQSHRR